MKHSHIFRGDFRTMGLKLAASVLPILLMLGLVGGLAACKKTEPEQTPPRPVKTMVVGEQDNSLATQFPGEVRARHEARLAFRVSGRILKRHVDVGAVVKKGQLIAELDPQDLRLAAAASAASVGSAQAQYETAKADVQRYRDLKTKNFISQAELDRHEANFASAEAALKSAKAQSAISGNQSDYARLVAPADGVITSVDAEAGQVVQAGQSVTGFAEPRELEVAFVVSELHVSRMHVGDEVDVSLWANAATPLRGVIREVAPAADPASRTYAVRVSLPQTEGALRLGMTAIVSMRFALSTETVALPAAALIRLQEGKDDFAVWQIDVKTSAVHRVPVRVAGFSGNQVLVASGLQNGSHIVVAGAHHLHEGEVVRPLSAAVPTTTAVGETADAAKSAETAKANTEQPASVAVQPATTTPVANQTER